MLLWDSHFQPATRSLEVSKGSLLGANSIITTSAPTSGTPSRVLPSQAADRYCFTMWLSEGRSQARPPTPLQPEVGTSEEAWRRLVHPSLRKHAARWWLRDEWAASLEQAHPPSPARDALLEGFWGELGIIERVVKPLVDRAQPPGPPVTEWL